MSKIQITELNSQASKLNFLNQAEIAEVIGGYCSFSHRYSLDFNADILSRFNIQATDIEQLNNNGTIQVTVDGKKYSFTGQHTKTGEYSFVLVS